MDIAFQNTPTVETLETFATDLLRDHRFQSGIRRLFSKPQGTWQSVHDLWRRCSEYEQYQEENGIPLDRFEDVLVLWIAKYSFPHNDSLVAFYSAKHSWYCVKGYNRDLLQTRVILQRVRCKLGVYSGELDAIVTGAPAVSGFVGNKQHGSIPYRDPPLELAFISAFNLNDAVQVISDEMIKGFSTEIAYIQSRKHILDTLLVKNVQQTYTKDEVIELLHQFIEPRLEDYVEEGIYLTPYYPVVGEVMANILSKRQSLAALLYTLETWGGSLDRYVVRLRQTDYLLKERARIDLIYECTVENTPEGRLNELVPPSRWWWYRDSYL